MTAPFLLREQAPLNEADWAMLDAAVQGVARRLLVGRRILPLWGPVGPGLEVVPVHRLYGWDAGRVDMTGTTDDPVVIEERVYLRLPLLHKDFVLYWRDLEQYRRLGVPLDWSVAEAAAAYVAEAEDHLIFHGSETDGVPGLLSVEGRHVLPLTPGEEPGAGFHDVVRAIRHLTAAGFYPPFATVAGPTLYAAWHRLFGSSGVLEVEQIRKLTTHGVFVSPLVPDQTVLVVAVGAENADVAVGLDLSVGFLETAQMNHHFRVLEVLTPRIKRAGSIVVLTGDAASA
jgi:uncharacterized linocin/CFP29 family protein